MGAWIETVSDVVDKMTNGVAPYVGAWIETVPVDVQTTQLDVAPYVGAWIETAHRSKGKVFGKSHPTWVRGLKLDMKRILEES